MKIYIYKLLVTLFFLFIFFELTIGARINYFIDKINMFNDHHSRLEIKEKLKDELRKAIDKDNYLTVEERTLISNFIKKLKKELDLETSQ